MDALKQARRDAVTAFMFVIFFVMVIACLSFADDGKSEFTHNLEAAKLHTEAAQGINNIYAFATALAAIAAVVFKGLKDWQGGKQRDDFFEKAEDKFDKLFSYTDKLRDEQKTFEGRMSSVETTVKGMEKIMTNIEAINKELKDIQLNIKELLTLQKAYPGLKGAKNG